MHFYRLTPAAFACFLLALSPAPAQAADSAPFTVKQATIGLGGKYKAGYWQPVRLRLVAGPAGARGMLRLMVRDGDQVNAWTEDASGSIDLPAGQETTRLLYAKAGPIAAPIVAQLADAEGRVVWSQDLKRLIPEALPSTQHLVVAIGPSVGLDAAIATIRRPAEEAFVAAQVKSPAELPDRWWGYEGVNTAILATSDPKFMAGVTDEQRTALLDWIKLGGRAIVCVGTQGEKLLEEANPWSDLAPGTFVEVTPLRERSGLETFTKAPLPFDEAFFQRNRPQVTRLRDVSGRILVDEGNTSESRPLVVHAPLGLGQVLFVALDLDHPSLESWKGRPRLVAALLQGRETQREQGERGSRRSVAHLGYDDLVGQLRAALDQYPGVTLVSFTTVGVLTLAYLLLIGPGDYLLLGWLHWSRWITWLTFPIVVLALGGIAWYLGAELHGRKVQVNQVELIDIDASQQLARGTVWTHLYSPSTSHYAAELRFSQPAGFLKDPQGWLAWQGLPGESLGGLSSRQVVLAAADPYRLAPPGDHPQVSGLPVQIASSKSLSARWWSPANLTYEGELKLDQFGLLAGEFRQPLPVELTDALLVHGEKLYRLGRLKPGQTIDLKDHVPLNLEARLTERTVVEAKDVSTPWDQSSTEIPRIMQMMMLHEAARGRNYTGLHHRYQSYVDLTDQALLGRAILIGRSATGVSQLEHAGEPIADDESSHTWTWYRVVLPVGQSLSGSR